MTYLFSLSIVSLLGILKLRKDTGAIVLTIRSILCLQISCSWSPFMLLSTESSYCIRVYPFFTICSVISTLFCSWISSSVSPEDTTKRPTPKPSQEKDFRRVYTHRQKVPVSEPVPTDSSPEEGPPPQPSAPLSDLDVPIALRKCKRFCTVHLFPNLFSMIVLIHLFASLPCLCLLYLSLEVIWGGYIGTYLKASNGWRDEWSCFSRNLGVGLCTHRCCS